jgi:hypothetical protein
MRAGLLDFAGGTVVHLNAGIAGLVAAYVIGQRYGYGSDNFAPYDLSLAVIGTGLLWVGWFGFNGSALAAGSRAVFAIMAIHLAASTGALTWMLLEWWTRGKPWHDFGRRRRSRHDYARIRVCPPVAWDRNRLNRGRGLFLGLYQVETGFGLR